MRLLVTGATGFVGGWIVDGAVAAGFQIRVLVRDGAAAGQRLPAGVEILVGSLTDAALLDRALAGVDVLVHAAAYQYGHAVGTLQRSDNPVVAGVVLAAAARAGSHIDNSTGTAALGRPFRPVDETVRDSIAWWTANGLVKPAEAGAAQSEAAKP